MPGGRCMAITAEFSHFNKEGCRMTSQNSIALSSIEIVNLRALAVLRPGYDVILEGQYRSLYQTQPQDKGWAINNGPDIVSVLSSPGAKARETVEFAFMPVASAYGYKFTGTIDFATRVGGSVDETLVIITGSLKKAGGGDKLQDVRLPCYYNARRRCGFALMPWIISYEAGRAQATDLNYD